MIRLGGITVAKRVTKKVNSTELDSKEFFAAIAQIEEEKGIKKGTGPGPGCPASPQQYFR